MIEEDLIIRNFLESTPSYIDEKDQSIVAFDSNFKGYTAKELAEHTKKLTNKVKKNGS